MLVVTAATPWEARPLVRCWDLEARDANVFEGRVGGRPVRLIRTGIGLAKTAAALAGIETGSGLVAVSSGLAGALQPGVRSGDLVADLRGAPVETVEAAREAARDARVAIHMGAFHTVDAVMTDPAAKRALGEKLRVVAVDMESAAVREWCQARGGVFIGLRAVLDAVDDRLPEGLPEDDSARAMARFAMAQWRNIPLLVKTGLRQRRAMDRLARFLDHWLRRL